MGSSGKSQVFSFSPIRKIGSLSVDWDSPEPVRMRFARLDKDRKKPFWRFVIVICNLVLCNGTFAIEICNLMLSNGTFAIEICNLMFCSWTIVIVICNLMSCNLRFSSTLIKKHYVHTTTPLLLLLMQCSFGTASGSKNPIKINWQHFLAKYFC
jgi:hypothetical protein